MSDLKKPIAVAAAAVVISAAVALGLWHILRAPVAVRANPARIMGTRTELTIVVPRRLSRGARADLAAAANSLRDAEALMSVHLADSALSRFNAAPAGRTVKLPGDLLELLRRAESFTRQSDGAFDVTCRPVIQLWRAAKDAGREPTDTQIAHALQRVGMRYLTLSDDGAAKLVQGVQVDLGGIAKGYAVDAAAAALRSNPAASGGIVNAGGDLRCFGTRPGGEAWRVGIQHPFREGLCGAMLLTDAAVATSGDYRRYFEIAGRRYSHIVDPRTGRPVERTPSVTVVSLPADGKPPSATDADAWATALSVLGPPGLKRIEARAGMEAMIITGTPDDARVHMTKGFGQLLPGKIRLD